MSAIQMQKQILRSSQQLHQTVAMSNEQPQESQAHSQNYQNHSSNNMGAPYRIQLTPQQAAYLIKHLPYRYSFQLESRPLKRAASSVKNMSEPVSAPEAKKKASKEESKTAGTKQAPSRTSKANVNRVSQEFQNAVYQKYNAQKEFKKNSFENVSDALRPCIRILTLLKNNRTSWPFREPVDPIALGIPHYTEIVKEPMDLSTIENNLRANQYFTQTQFHADVAKIISNSYLFNKENPQFTKVTSQFENYYRKITDPNSEMIRTYSRGDIPSDSYPAKMALQAKKSKKQTNNADMSYSSQQISMAQKKELGMNIKKLQKEDMKGILDIVQEGTTGKIVGEFDLKELDAPIIRRLQVYVKDKLQGERKSTGMNGNGNRNDNDEESSFEVSDGDQSN